MNWLFLSLFLAVFSSYAGSGKDRCYIEDCVCPVRVNKTKEAPQTTEIFFGEDSYELDSRDEDKVRQFVRSHPGKMIYISGYADACGDANHNKRLSVARAVEVKRYVTGYGGAARVYKTFGEASSSSHIHSDRKVILSVRPDSLARKMDQIKNVNLYIVDASGSISSQWGQVVNYKYPAGASVVLSKVSGCRPGDNIRNVRPSGGTEIWYSFWYSLKHRAKYGDTVMVISDFHTKVPLSSEAKNIINKVIREKNLRVHYIYL